MNRSIILLALLLTIGFQIQSCNDDDEPVLLVTTDVLEGAWTAVSYTATETYNLNSVGQVAAFNHHVEGFDLDYEVTFEEDAYTSEGSYAMDVLTVTYNGSPSGNESVIESDVLITGDYSATENALMIDSTFFRLTLGPMDLSGGTVEQTLDYEIDSTGMELIINQSVEYYRDLEYGGSMTITSNSTSTWSKL